jgi:hypothetical protein
LIKNSVQLSEKPNRPKRHSNIPEKPKEKNPVSINFFLLRKLNRYNPKKTRIVPIS